MIDLSLLCTKTWLGKDAPCACQAAASKGKQLSDSSRGPCLSSLVNPADLSTSSTFPGKITKDLHHRASLTALHHFQSFQTRRRGYKKWIFHFGRCW